MQVLAAPDKFRGTLTAAQAASAIREACSAVGLSSAGLPLADGGEGTVDAFGGANRVSVVTGPNGAQIDAPWRLHKGTAVIEASAACGLLVAGGASANDPVAASTKGVGELVGLAIAHGARRVVIGVGGSASTDGGAGALSMLQDVSLESVDLVVCCDVKTRFTNAARDFGPQKGADAEQVLLLSRRLAEQRLTVLRRTGVDLDRVPGTGAAGGLAGGLLSLGAKLRPGFDSIANLLGLDAALALADVVVTGEGRLDRTSLNGKVVGGVVTRARRAGKPVVVVTGRADIAIRGFTVLDLTARFGSRRALDDTYALVVRVVTGHFAALDSL